SGQVLAAQHQLSSLLQTYPPDVHRFWQLTAQQVAGVEGVVEEFRELQTTASAYLQPMIARRLEHPLPTFDVAAAGSESAATMSLLHERIDHDVRYGIWSGDAQRRPWATWA